MKWRLRWVSAGQGIWKASQLRRRFIEVGYEPSLSKVAKLWREDPVSIRLDELDYICAALNCSTSDLLEVETVVREESPQRAVGEGTVQSAKPAPGASKRLPPV